MLKPTTNRNSNRNRVKHRTSRPHPNNVTGRLPSADKGLSDEEVDRRALAAANRIPPGPQNLRSDRKKPK
jgi:hypothetical protein